MKEIIMGKVIRTMSGYLDENQLQTLKKCLDLELLNYEIKPKGSAEKVLDNHLSDFISAKRVEGLSEKSLNYYQKTISRLLESLNKCACEISTDEIRNYLSQYQRSNKVSQITIDNVRRILSTYFSWMEDEDYILKSPIRRIHKIKTCLSIKEVYSDEDLEKMRDACTCKRDLAIVDLLSSTGMRIGELVKLNRSDINFAERECKVLGKGNKERVVYFDARTKIHLQEYLISRNDDNPALIISLRKPLKRIGIGGIELRLKAIGKKIDLGRVHPHKFRRSMATKAIDKGMPIEQLQVLLGHKRIDTTLQYAMVNQMNVKQSHRRYIG